MELSKLNALLGEIEPYTPSGSTLRKALMDVGVNDADAPYTVGDKRTIAKAAVAVLKKLIVLSSDSLGKSSQGYNVGELEKRIKALCKENDLEVDDSLGVPTVEDGSMLW